MAASSSLRWHGPRVTQEIRDEMKARLLTGAEALAEQVRQNIDTQGPPASAPGQFPHRRSGELHDSIKVSTDRRSLSVTVIATAEHAAAVEAKRPFLRRTLREFRSRLRAIILSAGGKSGRFKFK